MNRLIDGILIGFLALVMAAALIHVRPIQTRRTPIHKGIPPEVQPLVNQYKILAGDHNIHFSRSLTIGFTEIKEDSIIGLCHYGPGFREIDLDKNFWDDATETQKKTLAFHELTHCLCGRGHDYGFMQLYPEASEHRMTFLFFKREKGYMSDGCPLSIMHPIIISDRCIDKHYNHYIEEMWERCAPW